ncbi:MAG: hypothetical protein ACFCBW_04850 [Candidatus Competibacterales bacterium]
MKNPTFPEGSVGFLSVARGEGRLRPQTSAIGSAFWLGAVVVAEAGADARLDLDTGDALNLLDLLVHDISSSIKNRANESLGQKNLVKKSWSVQILKKLAAKIATPDDLTGDAAI